ncbi:MAG: hypothetical protein KC933_32935, partial [Myxococcales bacterium]|nr:hypothetical protein [Myxococcales bacterium]
MSRAARTVLLVGHDEATRARLEVRARLRGLEPVSCVTGEAALTRAEAEPPFAVISALVLPGASGLVVLAELERRWPGTHTVLLSDIPPGPSPQARVRLAVDAILVRRGAWEPAVVQAALQTPVVDASLDPALDSGDPEAVAALVRAAALDEAGEALALTHLAAAAPPQVALPILEEALSLSPPRPARFVTALDVAAGLGEAGLEVLIRVAEGADAPPEVRGRAMRRVAATAPLPSVRACLGPLLSDPRLALDAADALMEAATAAGPEGFEVLRELCTTDATPESVRVAALGHLFEAFGRAEVAPVLSALTRAAPPALKAEASRLLARADEFSLEALVAAAEDPARPVAERKAALARAAADLPKAEALALLERAQVAEAPALALAGFELAASRADTDFEATFTRAARAGAGALQAVLLGIMKLGPRGAPALERLVFAPWVPPTVRGQALRLLALRFPARIAAPKVQQSLQGEDEVLHDAAVLAALQLGRTGWALLYSTLSSSAPPTARAAALAALDRHAPAELVQEALRRAS